MEATVNCPTYNPGSTHRNPFAYAACRAMDQTVSDLANKVMKRFEKSASTTRVVVGICGVPGSGKTRLAALVSAQMNELARERHRFKNQIAPFAVDIPMDGFHYSRAQLSAMSNPIEAHHRRGAAFTFDAAGFLKLVSDLANPALIEADQTVWAPSFDHALKDPVEHSIPIAPQSRIVVIEGNYCGLDRRPWSDAAMMMDELWYVDCPRHIAHERLARRHLASKIVDSEVKAWERAQGTDELNAEDIRNHLLKMDEIISAA